MKYIKPLDGLRAVAVLMVIVWHWVFKGVGLGSLGPAGLVLFYVLSGYLITSILLTGKNNTEKSGESKKVFLINFYIRRSLRIFPVYYLIIIPCFIYALYHHSDIEKYFYYATYTTNFYFVFKLNGWDNEFAHLWSLAVEEQFYLFWPFVILFIHKKYLLHLIVCFVLTGVITQCIIGENGFSKYLTFACFDSLGMGAFLAWVFVYKPGYLKLISQTSLIIAVPILLLLPVEIFYLKSMVFPFRIQATILSFSALNYIVYNFYINKPLPAIVSGILQNKLLVKVGKMSYSLYLFHNFITYETWKRVEGNVYDHLPNYIKENFNVLFFIFNFIILIMVASISRIFIEQPFLKLKNTLVFKPAPLLTKITASAI